MWLTGRLAPDHKTIADFRRRNGAAICAACAQFIVICRNIGLFTRPLATIDGSKFKGVNARDKNFTRGKVRTRLDKLNEIIARYLPRSMPLTARRAWMSHPAASACATSSCC
jgi:transposase